MESKKSTSRFSSDIFGGTDNQFFMNYYLRAEEGIVCLFDRKPLQSNPQITPRPGK